MLNPDLHLEVGAVAVLVEQFPADRAVILSPLLLQADSASLVPLGTIDTAGMRWTRSGRHLDALQGQPKAVGPSRLAAVDGVSGAASMFSRRAVEVVTDGGGELYDDAFFAYREDAELAIRARRCGVEMYCVPAATGLHCRRLSGTTRAVPGRLNQLGVQNRFLMAFRYGWSGRPGATVPTLLRDVVVVVAVLTRERSSLPGLRRAWSIRRSERFKGRAVRPAPSATKPSARR